MKQFGSVLIGLIVGWISVFPPTTVHAQGGSVCATPGLTVSQTECQALEMLYDSTNGTNRTQRSGRKVSVDVEARYGVTLGMRNGSLRVTSIVLSNNNLVGTLPDALANLPYLETLTVGDNSITHIPASIGALSALVSLDVHDNLLTSLPDAIGSLTALSIADFSENSLSAVPGTIGSLVGLDSLRLDQNALSTLPSSIGNLTELDILNISHNQLTSLPAQIGQLSDLDSLDVKNNQLSVLPDTLAGLDSLLSLDLSNNALSVLPDSIGDSTTLVTLTVDNNPLSALPASIGNLTALQTLSVAFTSLTAFPETISGLTSLITLKANNALLTGLPVAIAGLDTLEYVYLQYNAITGTFPLSFSQLSTLKRLYVYNNLMDRTTTHLAVVPTALTAWMGSIPIVFRNNQGDATPPSITFTGSFDPFIVEPTLPIEIMINENSYAVSATGAGMRVVFSGAGACSSLQTTPIMVSTGTVSTHITVNTLGIYTDCRMTLYDHAGNASIPLSVPSFVYGEVPTDFCDHPSISVPLSECVALIHLYTATQGTSWTNDQNRLESLDIETRFGVRTGLYNGQRHVDGLFLQKSSGTDTHGTSTQRQGNNLQGVLPDALGDLAFLKDINVSKNTGLVGALPATLGNIVALQRLYAMECSLEGSMPAGLENLTQLQYLYLGNNNFTGSLPDEIGAIRSLQALDLQGNGFGGTVPVSRSGLTNIRYLGLQNNALSGTLPSFFAAYTGLQYLHLQENNFIGSIPTTRSALTAVKEFFIQGNSLDRDKYHYAAMPASLQSRYQARQQRNSSEQRDTIAPVISGNAILPWLLTGTTVFSLTVQENSYAVDLNNEGMQIVFSGAGNCETISGGQVTVASGVAQFTIQPVVPGLYEACYVAIEDHANIRSGWIALPRFGYSISIDAICFHPDLTVPLEECAALAALYTQTQGTGRSNDTARGVTHDVGQRYGVTVANRDGRMHVVSVALGNNALSGAITLSSLPLPYLESLTLSQNSLAAIHGSRSGFTSLQTLHLQGNVLSGALYESLGAVPTLRSLDLSDNNFSGIIPLSRSSLVQLVSLNLSFNQITGQLPVRAGSAANLISLQLQGNAFKGGLPFERIQLLSLDTLLLSYNALDRTVQHLVTIPTNMTSRVSTINDIARDNQTDTTPPTVYVLASSTGTLSEPFYLTATVYENSYPITAVGSGMTVSFTGSVGCSALTSPTLVTTGNGLTQILVVPTQDGMYAGCQVSLIDHAGNIGSASMPGFTYEVSCGDAVIADGEDCDEGRFCDDGRECTTNVGLCPTECSTRFVDNCNPLCGQSACGDGFLDTNGSDNVSATADDEQCDAGKFCNNGVSCSADPSVCPSGPSECTTRLTAGCNPYCGLATCGDGYVDLDGQDDELDTADDEECDDENLQAGDGCSASCLREACGDGFLDVNGINNVTGDEDDEACDNGYLNGLLGSSCSSTCRMPSEDCLYCYETCDGGTGSNSIYLLIDVSGSMGSNQKLQKAKEGAQEFVRLISNSAMANSGFTSKIGLITFSSDTVTNYYPSLDYNTLTGRIASLVAGGGTNFGDPLLDATNYFKYNDTSYQQYIILLSDGLPTNTTSYQYDPIEWAYYGATEAKQEGIGIYTISVEQTFEGNDLMRRISSSALQNMALSKTTTQSSTASSRHASYAVDNDIENTSRTQTQKQSNSWRQVNLGALYDIKSIKIRNRTGGPASKTSQYYIHVKTGAFTSNTLSTILADPSVESFYESGQALRPSVYDIDLPGRYVRVQLTKNEVLSMAEVEVLGCPYGVPCDDVYTFEDYESTAIELIYSHIFGAIHCNCKPERLCGVCGDGYAQTTLGEQCDEGSECDNGVSCTADPGICPDQCRPRFSAQCTSLCTFTQCGDGVVQAPNHDGITEQCDDGNVASGDGCSVTCVAEFCGDGILDADGMDNIRLTEDDEQCDDGDAVDTNDCANDCSSNSPQSLDGTCHEFGILYSLTGNGSNAPNQALLCDVGTASGFTYDGTGHRRNRYCVGEEGGSTVACSKNESFCGDGVTQQYSFTEQCDDGNRTSGDGCSSTCVFEAPLTKPGVLPTCYEGQSPVFQTTEPVPLVRQLTAAGGIDADATLCAERADGTIIPGGSMQCIFTMLHGNETSFMSVGPIVELPCFNDISTSPYSGLLFDYLEDYGISSGSVLGFGVGTGMAAQAIHDLGKYTLRLDRIRFTYCSVNENGEPIEMTYTYGNSGEPPICRIPFSLTDPYLTQKGSSFGSVKSTNFETYVAADGSRLLYDTATQEVQHNQVPTYSQDIVEHLTETFIDKHRRGAILPTWAFGSDRILRKVPGKELYFFRGTAQTTTITLQGQLFSDLTKPFTLVVEDADLIVEGSLEGNGLYIVKNGTVRLEAGSCDETQYIDGIFVTNEGFSVSNTHNSLQRNERCKRGNLQMKGILVGPGIDENFARSRRSMLDVINMPLLENYSQIEGLDISEITRQQKEKIYESSAISIQTNPAAREQLPEGSTYLFDALSLFKK